MAIDMSIHEYSVFSRPMVSVKLHFLVSPRSVSSSPSASALTF